jgi:imidazolonepropionase-like amidohydrolase
VKPQRRRRSPGGAETGMMAALHGGFRSGDPTMIGRTGSFIAAIVLLLASMGAMAATVAADVTVIRAGRLIDVRAGRVLSDQVIVVRDGRIESVGPTANILAGARLVDLSGMTVLPGLIDAHTHLVGDHADADPLAELKYTAAQRALQSLPGARNTLFAGFTTVRDVGTYRALVDVALRDAIERGDVVGPRMRVAGAYVTISGGAGAITGFSPDVTLPWDLRFGRANSPAEVRERVRALANERVDLIKVLATGAVLTHNSNPNARESSYDELRAAVEEASNFGLKVAAHAHNADGIKNAIRAGVASIEHGTMMDDEGRVLMKQHGTYLVPTLDVHECINAGNSFPQEFIERARMLSEQHFASFRKAVAAGVRIAFGTDVPVCAPGRNAREFDFMVQGGMTPLQAIQAATLNGADLLGMSERIGEIAPGKLADIIAVSGDPLTNVRVLESVSFVMKQGVIYKGE